MTKEELQQEKEEIERLLASARSDHASLQEIKDEANNIRSSMRGRGTQSENELTAIQQLHTRAEQLRTQIASSLESVTEAVSEIKTYYPEFQALQKKVDDEETGIEAYYNDVETYRDDAAALKKEADKIVVDIKTRLSEVEQLKTQSVQGRDQIQGLVTESESLKDSIQEHLDLITPSSLRGEFKQREKQLNRSVWMWFGVTIAAFLLLIGVVIYVFTTLAQGQFSGWSDWYRVLFITPALAFVVWVTRNYAMERKLLEKYAFKAVVSTSLTSYIKLLEDRFEDKDSILDFTMGALGKIYTEPYEDQSAKVRGNISLWNVFKANVELDEETKEKVKVEAQKSVAAETKSEK